MKKFITAATAVLIIGIAVGQVAADSNGNTVAPSVQITSAETRKEVERAIEHFRQAMIQRRPDWILSGSTSELTFGHSNGVVQTREEFAEVVRSGEEIFKRVDITNRHLTISGDVAIERHHFSADIVYKGELKTFELEVVEVWQKANDSWQLLARQAIKV